MSSLFISPLKLTCKTGHATHLCISHRWHSFEWTSSFPDDQIVSHSMKLALANIQWWFLKQVKSIWRHNVKVCFTAVRLYSWSAGHWEMLIDTQTLTWIKSKTIEKDMNRIQRVSQSGINASAVDNLVSFNWHPSICQATSHLAGHSFGITPVGHLRGHLAGHLGGHSLWPVGHLLFTFLLRAASVTSSSNPFLKRIHVVEIHLVWKGKG